MAYDCFCDWVGCASNPSEIEYIIGVDENDPSCSLYTDKFLNLKNNDIGGYLIDIGNSTNAIQAVNRIAHKISPKSEILVEVCDDIASFPYWDSLLFECLKGIDNFSDPKMIGTWDGLRGYGELFTQPIMNRACYNRLGFFLYPEYTSVWSDNDFTEVAKLTGFLVNAPHILFNHKHYSKGVTPLDDTYTRRNNALEAKYNRNIFLEREKRGFDL